MLLLSVGARAQDVPQGHIPPTVLMQVSLLERSFDAALAADCSSDRCFSKGCVYGAHQTIDMPRTTSLPGLPAEESIGSVPPQEYLVEARCEFTHEKSVATRDIQALVRRLQLRLSHGWLQVVVAPQALEPISKALAEPILPKEPAPPEPPKVDEPANKPVEPPPPPPEWSSTVALREFWLSLLPHFPWMVAILLLTIAAWVLIWAGRRLGATSLEERMLEQQMANAEPPAPEPVVAIDPNQTSKQEEHDNSFAEQQEKAWSERIAHMETNKDEMVVELLREWLKVGDFPMLARALFVFGDRLSLAFTTDPELALKKLDFAEYFRAIDENTLPSRAEFFRRLNQHAMSSLLLSQDDVQLYRALREDFGSSGVLSLMQNLPPRFAALLFAIVPRDGQHDVARLMPTDLRLSVASQLLASTRISNDESAYVFSAVGAARDGKPLPAPPKGLVTDRGPSVDAASALSVLLPHIPADERRSLFGLAMQRSGGQAPQWLEDVFFGEMLTRLPTEMRNDLLLDVDVRGLSAWLSMQDQEWRQAFVPQLAPSMQNALRNSGGFASRAEQLGLARRGHQELVTSLKSQYSRGRASFAGLVS
jgi:hypothetical protein